MRYLAIAALLLAACSPSDPVAVDPAAHPVEQPMEESMEQPMDESSPTLITTGAGLESAVGKRASVTGTLRSLARTARTPAMSYGNLHLDDGTVVRLARVHPSQGQGLIGEEVTVVGAVVLQMEEGAEASQASPVFALQEPTICAGRVADCSGEEL